MCALCAAPSAGAERPRGSPRVRPLRDRRPQGRCPLPPLWTCAKSVISAPHVGYLQALAHGVVDTKFSVVHLLLKYSSTFVFTFVMNMFDSSGDVLLTCLFALLGNASPILHANFHSSLIVLCALAEQPSCTLTCSSSLTARRCRAGCCRAGRPSSWWLCCTSSTPGSPMAGGVSRGRHPVVGIY